MLGFTDKLDLTCTHQNRCDMIYCVFLQTLLNDICRFLRLPLAALPLSEGC